MSIKSRSVNHKISWSQSIWFFDIDDTLIDTANTSIEASEGIRKVFEENFGKEKAKQIQNEFNRIFQLMLTGYRVKADSDWLNKKRKEDFEKLIREIESYQVFIKQKYGFVKKWSREVFIKMASERTGIKASSEIIHTATQEYWLTLTNKTKTFPDALKLIKHIKKRGRPIFLITSSDGRLKLRNDGQFDYDSKYSEGLKRQRIELLRKRGIEFDSLSVGDPEDKPKLDFFQKGIKTAELFLGKQIDLSNSVMVGDSFAGDLQTPKEKMGFGLVVLFQKGSDKTEIIDGHQINTGKLSDIVRFLN